MDFRTQLNPQNAIFQRNSEVMQSLVNDLKSKLALIAKGGNKKARERHLQHGTLSARERIQLLLDASTDFLELSAFAGFELYADDIPAAGILRVLHITILNACLL